MSSLVRVRRPLAVAAIALSLLTVFLIDAQPAAAHGSAIDPPSRHYGCARRWDTNWQNPVMQTQDPMCWQAWQANPAAMWTWNGLAAGASTTFGVLGQWLGTNDPPTLSCAATT